MSMCFCVIVCLLYWRSIRRWSSASVRTQRKPTASSWCLAADSTSVFPTVMLPVPVFCALPHVVCLFLVLVPPFEAMSDLFISLSLFFGYILSWMCLYVISIQSDDHKHVCIHTLTFPKHVCILCSRQTHTHTHTHARTHTHTHTHTQDILISQYHQLADFAAFFMDSSWKYIHTHKLDSSTF